MYIPNPYCTSPLAKLNDYITWFIWEHENFALVLMALPFVVVPCIVHCWIASAPPWEFLLFLADPGKTVPLFADLKHWASYVLTICSLSFTGWLGLWNGLTACAREPIRRSRALQLLAAVLAMVPLALVAFVWTGPALARRWVLFNCALVTGVMVLGVAISEKQREGRQP